jgi:hypothetical protein
MTVRLWKLPEPWTRNARAHRSLENCKPVFHELPQARRRRQGTLLLRQERGHFYFALTSVALWLDKAGSSAQSSDHDHHPHLVDRTGYRGDRAEPMGIAPAARFGCHRCVRYRCNRTSSWRHTHSVSCGGVHASHGWRPGFAVAPCLVNTLTDYQRIEKPLSACCRCSRPGSTVALSVHRRDEPFGAGRHFLTSSSKLPLGFYLCRGRQDGRRNLLPSPRRKECRAGKKRSTAGRNNSGSSTHPPHRDLVRLRLDCRSVERPPELTR